MKDKAVLVAPLDHLCQRCVEQVQWKIDYQKYKPLTKPRKCDSCNKPNIIKAYRMICEGCATAKKHEKILLCCKCRGNVREMVNAEGNNGYGVAKPRKQFDRFMNAYATPLEERKHAAETDNVAIALDSLKLRERKKVEREIRAGNVTFSQSKKKFVYTGNDEEVEYEINPDDESDGFPSEDDDSDDNNMSDQEG